MVGRIGLFTALIYVTKNETKAMLISQAAIANKYFSTNLTV
jgi:hypothetical protein